MDPLRSDVLVLKQALNTISFGSPRDLSGTEGKLRATTSQKNVKKCGNSEHVIYRIVLFYAFLDVLEKWL
jgi:hypothetical protein